MKILTWVLRVLLTGAFIMGALFKMTTPYAELLTKMAWVENFTPLLVKIIGGIELLGALGIMLPLLLKIKPKISAYATMGLSLTMIGAFSTHLVRGEFSMALAPLVFLVLVLFLTKRTLSELNHKN